MTVAEVLHFNAELRLPASVDPSTRRQFVADVLRLLELTPISDSVVGPPGGGLSFEELKRVTIGAEVVANPSIVFCDEPTTGVLFFGGLGVRGDCVLRCAVAIVPYHTYQPTNQPTNRPTRTRRARRHDRGAGPPEARSDGAGHHRHHPPTEQGDFHQLRLAAPAQEGCVRVCPSDGRVVCPFIHCSITPTDWPTDPPNDNTDTKRQAGSPSTAARSGRRPARSSTTSSRWRARPSSARRRTRRAGCWCVLALCVLR